MTQTANAGMLADEDMEFLSQIAKTLAERYGNYRVNLPFGAYITNTEQIMAAFPAVDQIIDARDKLIAANGVVKYQLVVPSKKKQREVIGEILGMPITTDPNLSEQQYLIKPVEELA